MNRLTVICLCCLAAAPATRPATSQSATASGAVKTEKPTPAGTGDRLKDDAPDDVKRLLHTYPMASKPVIAAKQTAAEKALDDLAKRKAGIIDPTLKQAHVIRHAADSNATQWVYRSQKDQDQHIAEGENMCEQTQDALNKVVQRKIIMPNADAEGERIEVGFIGNCHVVPVAQVIDGTTARLKLRHMQGDDVNVWVTGMNTSNLTDESVINVICIRITGTKSYATALGSQRTILKGERFDINDWLEK